MPSTQNISDRFVEPSKRKLWMKFVKLSMRIWNRTILQSSSNVSATSTDNLFNSLTKLCIRQAWKINECAAAFHVNPWKLVPIFSIPFRAPLIIRLTAINNVCYARVNSTWKFQDTQRGYWDKFCLRILIKFFLLLVWFPAFAKQILFGKHSIMKTLWKDKQFRKNATTKIFG